MKTGLTFPFFSKRGNELRTRLWNLRAGECGRRLSFNLFESDGECCWRLLEVMWISYAMTSMFKFYWRSDLVQAVICGAVQLFNFYVGCFKGHIKFEIIDDWLTILTCIRKLTMLNLSLTINLNWPLPTSPICKDFTIRHKTKHLSNHHCGSSKPGHYAFTDSCSSLFVKFSV